MTVGDGRVMHNAMSSLPDSSAAYSSLIRIVVRCASCLVAVALPLVISLGVRDRSAVDVHEQWDVRYGIDESLQRAYR